MKVDFYILEKRNKCFLCIKSGQDINTIESIRNVSIGKLYKTITIDKGEDRFFFMNSDQLLKEIESKGFSIVCVQVTFEESVIK